MERRVGRLVRADDRMADIDTIFDSALEDVYPGMQGGDDPIIEALTDKGIIEMLEDALVESTQDAYERLVNNIEEGLETPLSSRERKYVLGKLQEQLAGPIDWNDYLEDIDFVAIGKKIKT